MSRRQGFTLIELLVVIAIIVLLVSLLTPGPVKAGLIPYVSTDLHTDETSRCTGNLHIWACEILVLPRQAFQLTGRCRLRNIRGLLGFSLHRLRAFESPSCLSMHRARSATRRKKKQEGRSRGTAAAAELWFARDLRDLREAREGLSEILAAARKNIARHRSVEEGLQKRVDDLLNVEQHLDCGQKALPQALWPTEFDPVVLALPVSEKLAFLLGKLGGPSGANPDAYAELKAAQECLLRVFLG